jgi:hypothetical protein
MKPVGCLMAAALVAAAPGLLRADVKVEEKNQVHFEGVMGRMMGIFGGKAMREGTMETVAVRGNRKMTASESAGRIVDLDEQKVYELDMRSKTYKVVTFDEMKRRMQEAEERAKSQPRQEGAGPRQQDPNASQMQVDFDLKESGQKKSINGYDCREVVMTVTVHEKGKALDESGGMVMTVHEWLAPRIAAMNEIADFERRYAEKMALPAAGMPSAEQMAAAMAMYPMMKEAIGKFQAENVNMDGTAILTTMSMEAVESPEQAAQKQQSQQQQQRESAADITSVRGVLGGFGRKMARKRAEQQQQESKTSGSPNRTTIFTSNHEVVRVTTGVSPSDVAIPAGFRQK